MGRKSALCLFLILGLGACTQENGHTPAKEQPAEGITQSVLEQNTVKKLSYSLGVVMGSSLTDFEQVDLPVLFSAIEASQTEKKEDLIMDEDTARDNIMNEINKQREIMEKQQADQAETNKEASEAFLSENATKEGVIVLESGLQYKILQEGTGATPKATDTVEVHYVGTLIDGTVFDSSITRGAPVVFPVNGVIKGWTEALQLMKVGAKWKLYIPYHLAYGERGAGGAIGPFQTLIFDIELVEIVG